MNRIRNLSIALRLLLVGVVLAGAGSVSAVPLTMSYQVTDLGGGSYQYDFTLVVDNNDNTYAPGQAWRWIIFGDSTVSPSPLTGFQMASGQFPVGPWTSLGSTGGGHNGPSFNTVTNYWTPNGIGDALHWRGTSTADLAQGQLLWSNIAGTLNGATSANFVAATRVAPGITVDAVTGTASSVLNNETGGGNGYEAATFQILNNGTASETVTDITVEGLGTGDHTSVYSSFQIYEDVTGSGSVGSYDTGDTLIGTGSFAGGPPSTTISVPAAQQNFAASAAKQYFIVVQLNGTAITAQTLDYRITGLTVGGSSTVFNTPSREIRGLVIDGPRVDVAATAGTSQPVLNNEDGGGNGFEAGTFNVTATATAAVTVTSLTIRGLGTGDHTADYTEFAVYRDQTGSGSVGSYDTGDALIATGTFSGSPTEVSIPFSGGEQNFAASETKQYFIVIKLGGTASVTETFNYQVVAGTATGTAAVLSVPTATINGVNIIAPEVTFDGATPPVNPVVIPGASDQPVLAFDLTASNVSAQDISSIDLTLTGTITDSEVTEVKLWDDTNSNGLVDTGESQVGSTQTYSGGSLSFSGSPLITLAVNQSKSYVLTYTLAGSVASNTTFGVTLNPVSDINATPGPVRVTTAVPTGTQLVFLVSSYPYVQNFDAFPYSGYTPTGANPFNAGWYNDLGDGGGQWLVYRNSSPTGGTGPTSDHTTGSSSGQYVYVEDSNFSSSNGNINMISPPLDISGLTLPTVEFWLHNLVGNGAQAQYENTLHFDLIDPSTGNVTADFITAIKGNSNAAWQLVTVDLSSVTATVIQVRFRWEGTGSSIYNDIAIDDFSVRDVPDINVKNGSNMTVAAGGTDAVGTVQNTVTTTLNYTIENNGGVDLTVSTVTFANHSNVSPSATVLSSSPAATVTAGNTTTFDVQFNPIGAGAFQFDVTVTTNDPDTPNYTFTVSGTGQANAGPTISIPTTGSNWQANGSNFELFVDPGAAINDSLTADDPTPDNITITVTPPATTLTTLTTSPVTGGGTASTISMDWVGTADATNAPTGYVWTIQISDGITNVNFTATIFVNDLAPTSAAGTSATGGNGQGTATPYTGSALVGSTAALTLADMTNPNTGQAMTLGTITPDAGNPAGGSGFTVTFVADSIVLTPTAALQLADVGTHAFAVDIDDAGNTTTVYVSVDVVTPEIDVARNATPIADGGTDTITGALAGQSMVLTYDITNNGTSDLTITTVVLSTLVNCTANVTANPAGTVTPTNSTSFDVTVTPGVGAFSFDIAVNNDDVDEDPYDIAASGNAAAAPEIDVDRAGTPIADGGSDAPTTTYTGTGNDLVYTITNNGTSDLIITSITTGGLLNCTATVTVPASSPITPGNTADFTVQYTPTADGPTSFTISIINNDANENPYDITINATSTPAPTTGGSGGGGGGGCASSTDSTLPVMALIALFMLGAVVYRRRRA